MNKVFTNPITYIFIGTILIIYLTIAIMPRGGYFFIDKVTNKKVYLEDCSKKEIKNKNLLGVGYLLNSKYIRTDKDIIFTRDAIEYTCSKTLLE